MNILVIEDDFGIREAIGMVLKVYGQESDRVSTLEEGLGHMALKWPDAVVLDPELPGMDANRAYMEIYARFGRVPPIVVLSSHFDELDPRIKVPDSRVLPKPYRVEHLMDCIYDIASRGRSSASYVH